MNCNSNNITPAIARSESGKWHAGSSGKPSGGHGPRQINLVATLRRKVAAQAERSCKRGQVVSGDRISDRICDELIDLALHCKVAKVKLMAITAILDRLEGKPVTPVAIAPAELELVQRVRLAYDSVMKFAAANDLQMTPAEAVAWVAARESRAREILSEFITIDLMPEPAAAPAADDAAADANGTGVHTVQVHTVHHRQVMRLRDRDRQPQPILSSMQPGAATTRHRQGAGAAVVAVDGQRRRLWRRWGRVVDGCYPPWWGSTRGGIAAENECAQVNQAIISEVPAQISEGSGSDGKLFSSIGFVGLVNWGPG